MTPDYTQIYTDIITELFPEKIHEHHIMKRLQNIKTANDVILINEALFKYKKENIASNQKLKSYDYTAIMKILDYQKKHNLSNSDISRRYKLSRNTIAKWKKNFLEKTLD